MLIIANTQAVEAHRGTVNIGSFLIRGVSEADKVMKAEVTHAVHFTFF